MHPDMLSCISNSSCLPKNRESPAQVRAKKMADWIHGHLNAGLKNQDIYEMMHTAIMSVVNDTDDHLNSSERVFANMI